MRLALWLQTASFLLILVAVIAIGFQQKHIRRLSHDGVQSHTVLCVRRSILMGKIKKTDAFLKSHPEGVPGLISADDLRASRADQQAELNSMASLTCPKT